MKFFAGLGDAFWFGKNKKTLKKILKSFYFWMGKARANSVKRGL
jgi:hypothetical protein